MTTHLSTAERRPPRMALSRRRPPVLGLRLIEGACRRLELARQCIEQGVNPRRRLRSAMRRITRLPATLAPYDAASIANLADLSAYICRELSTVGGGADLGTLERMCDLLREIRCAWVTLPPQVATCDAARAARA